MARHQAYEVAKTAFTLYGEFFQSVAREIGKERTLALHCGIGRPLGRQLAGSIVAKSAGRPIELKALSAAQEEDSLSLGCIPEIEVEDGVSRQTLRECPFYDGLRASGLDHASVESMCCGISLVEYDALREACPAVQGSLQFRACAEGTCVEEWTLVK